MTIDDTWMLDDSPAETPQQPRTAAVHKRIKGDGTLLCGAQSGVWIEHEQFEPPVCWRGVTCEKCLVLSKRYEASLLYYKAEPYS